MSEDSIPEFDSNRIAELIEKHRTATTQREQREIENEVLTETVWNDGGPSITEQGGYTLKPEEVRTVYQALQDADANEGAQKVLHDKLTNGL